MLYVPNTVRHVFLLTYSIHAFYKSDDGIYIHNKCDCGLFTLAYLRAITSV